MRVIVCGSRGWTDRKLINEVLSRLPPYSVVIHGDAKRGADHIADEEARRLGFVVEKFPAQWDTHGKRAGFIRNDRMVSLGADLVIAFWDGRSHGTLDTINRANARSIPVEVHTSA